MFGVLREWEKAGRGEEEGATELLAPLRKLVAGSGWELGLPSVHAALTALAYLR